MCQYFPKILYIVTCQAYRGPLSMPCTVLYCTVLEIPPVLKPISVKVFCAGVLVPAAIDGEATWLARDNMYNRFKEFEAWELYVRLK